MCIEKTRTLSFCRFRVMVLNTTFQQYFSNMVAISFIDGVNQSTRRKPLTSDLPQVAEIPDHIMYREHLAMSGIRTHNLSDNLYRPISIN